MMFIKTAVTILSLGVYVTGELCVDSNLMFKIESGEETTCSNLVANSTLDCTQSDTLTHCKHSCHAKFCCEDSQATFKAIKRNSSMTKYLTCDWKKLQKKCDVIPDLVDTCPVTCGKCNPVSVLLGMIGEQGEDIISLKRKTTDKDDVINGLENVAKEHVTRIEHLENELFGHVIYGDNLYKVVAERMDWATHKAAAAVWGGDLASIHTKEENAFILSLIKEQAWIGLKDDGGNDWKWTDETEFNYSNWHTGEPNSAHETVTHMYYHPGAPYDGKWNDSTMGSEYFGVYKKPRVH